MAFPTRRAAARAASRRSSSTFGGRFAPLVEASRSALKSWRDKRPAVAAPAAQTEWRVETLEPRLLLSADAMPGITRIDGAIDQPGERDVYEFVITEQTRLLFDGVNGDQTQWSLTKDGTSLFGSQDLTGVADRFLDLRPGTYRLTVDGLFDRTGTYSFRLVGEEAAVQLQVNELTTGRLQPGTQAALYSFDAAAGDRLLLQPASGSGPITWNLFDPNARIIFSSNSWNSGNAVSLARSGTYWLSIEGPPGASSAIDYAFTVNRSTPVRSELTLGQAARADLSLPGSVAVFDFTLEDPTFAFLDLATPQANVVWTLSSATGGPVATGYGATFDGGSQLLRAGRYSLRMEANGSWTGPVDFRLLTANLAEAAGPVVLLDDAGDYGSHVVRVQADGAEAVSLAYLPEGGGTSLYEAATWRIISAVGTRIAAGTISSAAPGSAVLPGAGTYYIWVNRIAGAVSTTGAFQIARWPVNNAATPVTLGTDTLIQGVPMFPAQTQRYELTVESDGTWIFDSEVGGPGEWMLEGPTGPVKDWYGPLAAGRSLNLTRGADAMPVHLSRGTYTLTVKGATEGFRLRASTIDTAVSVGEGTTVVPSLELGESVLLRTAGGPLDSYEFALSGGSAFRIRVFNALGQLLYQGPAESGSFQQTRALGDVYLRISREAAGQGEVALTLQRAPAAPSTAVPIVVGQPVEALPTQGAATVYSFEVTREGMLVIEPLSTDWSSSSLRLQGPGLDTYLSVPQWWYTPSGTVMAPAIVDWALPGRYTLTMLSQDRPLSFVVREAAAAPLISTNTAVDLALAPGQSTAIFRFNAQAGVSYGLNGLPGADWGLLYVIYDDAGFYVDSGNPDALQKSAHVASRDGTYTVVISRSPQTSAQPARVAFEIRAAQATPTDAGVLTPGSAKPLVAAVPAFVTQSVQFEVTEAGFWTALPDSVSFDTGDWYLRNLDTNEPTGGRAFWPWMPPWGSEVYLKAGRYELVVYNGTGQDGSARFSLVPPRSVAMTAGTPTALGELNAAQAVELQLQGDTLDQHVLRVASSSGSHDYEISAWDAAGKKFDVYSSLDFSTGELVATVTHSHVTGPMRVFLRLRSDPWIIPSALTVTSTTTPVASPAVDGTVQLGGWQSFPADPTGTRLALNIPQDGAYFVEVDFGRPWIPFGDQWYLRGASDTTPAYDYISGERVIRTLSAGEYRLSFSGADPVRVRVTSLATTAPVALGTEQTVMLPADGTPVILPIDLAADDLLQWSGWSPSSGFGRIVLFDGRGLEITTQTWPIGLQVPMIAGGRGHVVVYNDSGVETELRFTMNRVPAVYAPVLRVGAVNATSPTTIDIPITGPNQRGEIRFEIPAGGAWQVEFITDDPGINGELRGGRAWTLWNTFYDKSLATALIAGTYSLSYSTGSVAIQNFRIRLSPLAAVAQPLPAGGAQVEDLAQRETRYFAMDVSAGDTLRLQMQATINGDPTSASSFLYSVYNEQGRQLLWWTTGDGNWWNPGPTDVSIPESGRVYVAVQRWYVDGTTRATLNVDRIPGAPQPEVQATPIRIGEAVDFDPAGMTFEFDVAEDGYFAIDWRGGSWQTWRLKGPQGTLEGAIYDYTSGGVWEDPVRWLTAGRYQLSLANGAGAAFFTVRSLAGAAVLEPSAPLTVAIPSDTSLVAVEVELKAGESYSLRALSGQGWGLPFRLLDASGATAAQGDAASYSGQSIRVERDGRYLLAIVSNGYSDPHIRLELVQNPRTLPLLASQEGVFYLPNEQREYSFSITEPTLLVLRETVSGGYSNRFELYDAGGNQALALVGGAFGGGATYSLVPGTYTLRLTSGLYWSSPWGTPFAFTAMMAPAVLMQSGQATSITWDSNGNPSAVLQLDLVDGETRWLTPQGEALFDAFEYRIYDPVGREVSRGQFSNGAYWISSDRGALVQADMSGRYTVHLVKRSYGGNSSTNFTLSQVERTVAPYAIGSTITGTLASSGDRARFTFQITEPTSLWFNISGGEYSVSLLGAPMDALGYDPSIANNPIARRVDLAPGRYVLQFTPTRDAPGSFSFSATPLQSLATLLKGETVSTTLQSRETAVWTFEGQAGQDILIDTRTTGQHYWQLVGPDGEYVAGNNQWYDQDQAQRVRLNASGFYLLSVRSSVYPWEGPITSTVRVTDAQTVRTPMRLGDLVTGTIGAPGNLNEHVFVLAEETTVIFDNRSSGLQMRLTGPEGEGPFYAPDASSLYSVLRLKPGTYTVAVSAVGSATPSYAFRLFNPAMEAIPALIGDVSGELAAGRSIATYRFDVAPGSRCLVDLDLPDGWRNVRFSVVDSAGRVIGSSYGFGSSSFIAPSFGPVYVIVAQDWPVATPFSLTVREQLDRVGDLFWDSRIAYTFQSSADQISFRFEMTQSGWIELQDISTWGWNDRIEIFDIGGRYVGGWSAWQGTREFQRHLAAGSYVLRLSGSEVEGGSPLNFIARRVPAEQQLDRQGGVNRTISVDQSTSGVALWSLQARAGDVLTLTASAEWAPGTSFQILSPEGYFLLGWTPSPGEPFTTSLPSGGTYLLRVVSTGASATPSSLTLQWGTAQEDPPIVSTFSGAGSLQPYQSAQFQFELTEPGLWYLDQRSGGDSFGQQVRLTDVNGQLVANAMDRAAWLAAGRYTLTIDNFFWSPTSYDFVVRRLDSNDVVSLGYGQGEAVTLQPNQQAPIYRIDAQRGDVVKFNALWNPQWSWVNYAVLNRYGQVIANGFAGSDGAPLTVDADGPLYFVFERSYWDTSISNLVFQIDNVAYTGPTPIVLGQTVQDTLTPAAQTREYVFELTEPTAVLFDRINGGTGPASAWTLVDAASGYFVASGSFTSEDFPTYWYWSGEQPVLSLQAGRYVLRVSTSNFINSSFGFRLTSLQAATPVASGQMVEGVLDVAGSATVYSIDAQAGDRLYVDLRDLLPRQFVYDPVRNTYRYNYAASARIVDPYGRVLAGNDIGDLEAVALVSGRYSIVLDDTQLSDDPVAYRLAVYVNRNVAPEVIALNITPRTPDLVADAVTVLRADAAGEITSGSTVDIRWTVRNVGRQTTVGDFTDRVVVRAATGEVIAEMRVPYSAAAAGAVLPGQFVTRSVQLRLPHGLQGVGSFAVTIETDVDNLQIEGDKGESNNLATAGFNSVLAPYANLQASDISLQTPGFAGGNLVTVAWKTRNAGTAAATGEWAERVEFVNLTTGAVVLEQTLVQRDQSIAAGGETWRSVQFAWPSGIDASGEFQMRVVVDALAQVLEYDATGARDDDNSAVQRYMIGPDLIVRNVALVQSFPRAGETVTLVWEDVNTGISPTPLSYQDRVVVRQRNADGSPGAVIVDALVAFSGLAAQPLLPGEARQRSFTFALPDSMLGAGTFDVFITADSSSSGAGVLFETNTDRTAESNNSGSGSFVALPPVADAPSLRLIARDAVTSRSIHSNSWDSVANRNRNYTLVPTATLDGWRVSQSIAGKAAAFEIWSSGDQMRNAANRQITVQAGADNGPNWLRLNDGTGQTHQTLGISREVQTIEGGVYTLSFDYAGALGQTAARGLIGIYVDGQLVSTYSNTSGASALNWQAVTVQFVGNGRARNITIQLEGASSLTGRSAMIDDLRIIETLRSSDVVAYGLTGTAIALPAVSASLTDTDGSETLRVELLGLPSGTVLSDGVRSITVQSGVAVDITGWNLSALTALPPPAFVGSANVQVRATATERSNGSTAATVANLTLVVLSGTAVATSTGSASGSSVDALSVTTSRADDASVLLRALARTAMPLASATFTVASTALRGRDEDLFSHDRLRDLEESARSAWMLMTERSAD